MVELITGYFRYNTHGLLNLAAAMFDISVGVIVLLQNPRSKINQSFFFLTVNTCIWLTCFGTLSLVRNPNDIWPWLSFCYFFGVPFIPITFYFLSSHLAGNKENLILKISGFGLAFLVMLVTAFKPERIFINQEHLWGRYISYHHDTFAVIYLIFLLVPFFSFLFMSFFNFLKAWRMAISPKEKIRMRNIFISVLIAYTGAIDFLTAFQFPIYPSGYISLTLFIAIVSYTIVRHQFLEINVLLRKFSVIFLIYSFLLAFVIPLSLSIINKNFSSLLPNQLAAVIGLALVLALAFSAGPFIYAYIIQHSFWLRQHSATGLTHELKSPLATIQSATQMLLDEQTEENPDKVKTYEYLHMVQRNAERLELFVKDLLSIAKIQNEDVSLQKSSIDLNKTISEVAETYALLAEKKAVSFKLELTQTPAIEADHQKIQQVISNLISNALKFSDGGTIHINTHPNGKSIHCSISDSGRGIPIKDLDRVFDRFYHGNHSNKGAGLGLTIAKAWVEAHGGKIWAESEGEGKGTRVTFTLPFSQV